MKSFSDIRMLRFDLRAATFTYSPGYLVTITYNPLDDSYEVIFDCDRDSPNSADRVNPHERMDWLLGNKLNELVSTRETRMKGTANTIGREFISVSLDHEISIPPEIHANTVNPVITRYTTFLPGNRIDTVKSESERR
jgi:hypothetical protein